ncbi:MAG: tyrosine-type recombinase/integrase [Clostridia bacterium]|nr:tyrosine-type recombinase/integrase [Clostridia bacterium]
MKGSVNMTINVQLIENFKSYLIDEEKSQATIEKYIRDVTAFFTWLTHGEIEKKTVLEYKEYLTQNYAPASVNSVLSSLNSFFEFNDMHCLKVKMLKIQRRIFASKDKELTKSEYERLLDAAKHKKNQKLYYLMQTICSSGIRVSEVKAVTVEAVRARQATIRCKGKMRVVILPRALCKMLSQYASKQKITSGPVFVTKTGKPLDRSSIWKMMKALCESAGVARDKVFPHNLRHLFARTYYTIQKDIVRLADILGHSSINTTRIYTMETGDIHRRQIQSLGLLQL